MKHIPGIKSCRFVIVLIIMCACFMSRDDAVMAKGSYTVKVSTAPCNKEYKKLATYNKKTKNYYMLKSYLEKLEKNGGGTLTLKKGTYNIPCTLYVPSNVTINLKKGVVLKKTAKTGTKKLKSSSSMFELVSPAAAAKNKATVKKYKGAANITIKGASNAAINMAGVPESAAIVCGHNKNVTISGITFKNMNSAPYVIIASSNKVSVSGCTFQDAGQPETDEGAYAVQIETADSETGAFPYAWSREDQKPSKNITIDKNNFTRLNGAIGSSKYTKDVLHTKIRITNNQFSTLTGNAVRILNWSAPLIQGNSFTDIKNDLNTLAVILASGSVKPSIVGNTFDNISIPVKFAPAVNTDKGKSYPTIFNTLDDAAKQSVFNNTVTNAGIYYIPYQSTLAETSVTRLGYFMDYVTKDYIITPNQRPYREYYTDNEWYNSYTNDYYVFKSYLDQLERVGGGTLTVTAGTYSITNTLYVPSNTKIIFKDGTVINKGTNTGFPSTVLVPSQSVFQLVTPSLALGSEVVGGYDGVHDVEFIGEGNVIMDMLYYYGATAIIMAHNNNVTVRGINFRHYLGHHFMEINSSQNVLVEKCTFIGSMFTGSSDNHKEAINIDTPDFNTGGLNLLWPKHDRTPVNNVTIQDSTFDNTIRAVGSHKYSVSLIDNTEQVYHTNLNILNNSITNTSSYGIRGINWKNCIIRGNTFRNMSNGSVAAIMMSGAVNPTITENIFDTANRPIVLNTASNSSSSLGDKAYPKTNTILDSTDKKGKNISDMLNNILIDVNKPTILYYIGGTNKANSEKLFTYKYDSSKVSYTRPIPTAKPGEEDEDDTPSPSPAPSTSPSPAPSATPAAPSASPSPTPEVPVTSTASETAA